MTKIESIRGWTAAVAMTALCLLIVSIPTFATPASPLCRIALLPTNLNQINGNVRGPILAVLAQGLESADGLLASDAPETIARMEAMGEDPEKIRSQVLQILADAVERRARAASIPIPAATPIPIQFGRGQVPTVPFVDKYRALLEAASPQDYPEVAGDPDAVWDLEMRLAYRYARLDLVLRSAELAAAAGKFDLALKGGTDEQFLLRISALLLRRFFDYAADPQKPVAATLRYADLAVEGLKRLPPSLSAELLFDFSKELSAPHFVGKFLRARSLSVRNSDPLYNTPFMGVVLRSLESCAHKYPEHAAPTEVRDAIRAQVQRALWSHVRPVYGAEVVEALQSIWDPVETKVLGYRALHMLVEAGDAEPEVQDAQRHYRPALRLAELLNSESQIRYLSARLASTEESEPRFMRFSEEEMAKTQVAEWQRELQGLSDGEKDRIANQARRQLNEGMYRGAAVSAARIADLDRLEQATLGLASQGVPESLYFAVVLNLLKQQEVATP